MFDWLRRKYAFGGCQYAYYVRQKWKESTWIDKFHEKICKKNRKANDDVRCFHANTFLHSTIAIKWTRAHNSQTESQIRLFSNGPNESATLELKSRQSECIICWDGFLCDWVVVTVCLILFVPAICVPLLLHRTIATDCSMQAIWNRFVRHSVFSRKMRTNPVNYRLKILRTHLTYFNWIFVQSLV